MADDLDEALQRVFYGREVLSFAVLHSDLALYEHHGLIAMEEQSLIPVLDALLEAVETAKPSWTALLPNSINVLDEGLCSKASTVYSTFRMDRYLAHIIQTKGEVWPSTTPHSQGLGNGNGK